MGAERRRQENADWHFILPLFYTPSLSLLAKNWVFFFSSKIALITKYQNVYFLKINFYLWVEIGLRITTINNG